MAKKLTEIYKNTAYKCVSKIGKEVISALKETKRKGLVAISIPKTDNDYTQLISKWLKAQ